MSNEAITVAILAGGQSSRMGTDKSFVLFNGKPLIQHVIERAGLLNAPIILIANDLPRYQGFGLPVYSDVIPSAGSLGGLYTALTYSRTGYTLCLACDMPLVNPDLLRYLITLTDDLHPAIVPRMNDDLPQALCALYHRRIAPLMARSIQKKFLKIRALLDILPVRYVGEDELRPFDPTGASFTNLNTPDDIAQIKNPRGQVY